MVNEEVNMNKWIDSKSLEDYREVTDEELSEGLRKAVLQVKRNLPEFSEKFPDANSEKNFYAPGANTGWTTGFWSGEIWIAYENAKDSEEKALFLDAGKKQIRSFYERIEKKHDVEHHDMGFLFSPSCVAGYKTAGDELGKIAALKAADQLVSRYQPVGEFIQAWGEMGAADNYRLIIDCLLNVPLLYWAAEITDNDNYSKIAEKHIRTTMKNILRKDNSTWHTVFFQPDTGAFDHGATCQGYKDSSAWARGQVWGIYGSAIAYKNTREPIYIDYFKRIADYFLKHLPDDICPFWDLSFGNGDENEEPRDSSSSAIAICGFLEMSKYLSDEDAAYYQSLAKKMMASLIEKYQVKDPEESNGQLLHGTYAKKTPFNTCKNSGVDECVIWGDYFFMEALNRMLHPDWNVYW